jgi:hypothetical protein
LNSEESYTEKLRREMREQDARRFLDPTLEPGHQDIFLMYVWQRGKWKLVTHLRGKVTPKRVTMLRRRHRKQVADTDVVRMVELRVARLLGGAGTAPLLPPRRRPTALQLRTAKLAAKREARRLEKLKVTHTHIPFSIKWGKCYKCHRRSLWYVGFTHARSHRRVVQKCCTRHAWYDTSWIPALHREQIVCVQRRKDRRLAA